MESTTVIKWVTDWGPLITLSSTVILATITAWLAYLTKRMADSASTAAEHSRVAAEASLASVAAAEATIDVQFELEPRFAGTAGSVRRLLAELVEQGVSEDADVTPELMSRVVAWHQVALTCRGATVTVHGLNLETVSVQEERSRHSNSSLSVVNTTMYDGGDQLVLEPNVVLPTLTHIGEVVVFSVSDRPTGEALTEITASVRYSIGSGPTRSRNVVWRKRQSAQEVSDAKAVEGQNDEKITEQNLAQADHPGARSNT